MQTTRELPTSATSVAPSPFRSQEEVAALAAALGSVADARVLETGCGDGALSAALAARGEAAELVATDARDAALRVSRARCVGARRVFVQRADPARLPFMDGTFDVVCARSTEGPDLDLDAALREARRVLRPGGRFVLGAAEVAPLCYLATQVGFEGVRVDAPRRGGVAVLTARRPR